MSHYFSSNVNELVKSREFEFVCTIKDHEFCFVSDYGVFSKDELDYGTKLLLESIEVSDGKSCLDVGTGYGVIGVFLNKMYNLDCDMIDVNDRAIILATKNVAKNKANCHVFSSDFFENITKKYDYIISNPPIRIGKEKLYDFYANIPKHLSSEGVFFMVINKKHGAESTIKKLSTLFSDVEIINKKKGFYIISAKTS